MYDEVYGPSFGSLDREALDGAIRDLSVASATDLIDDPADRDEARPRARCGARWQRAPVVAGRVPDLGAAERRELVVARWHAADQDDATVGQHGRLRGVTRFAERSGHDEAAEIRDVALARAGRGA